MINGDCKASFGTGDIVVTFAVPEAEHGETGYFILQNVPEDLGPQPIGHRYTKDGKGIKLHNTDTVFQFKNTESIDVLIDQLKNLKNRMLVKDTDKIQGIMLNEFYEFNSRGSIREIIDNTLKKKK